MTMGSLKQMLSLASPLEFQALQDICEYNDITEGQLICAPETITSMEMFMQGVPQICCLSFFQHLVSLSLVQQSIPSIEGLHNCPFLRILRLNENFIERLDELENCSRLEELYLHSNKIQHVKNLSHLTALEVLWLANNAIHEIEGLGHCVRLKELNIAQNPIKQLGEVSNLKSLEKLNVAATNVGSFKEVAKLSKLRVLRDLRFSDWQWGKSPICSLHNYQTYVLFRLSSLRLLDAEHVSEEEKQAANTIYTRKRVYYNMCIKTLKHRKSEIVNLKSIKESKRMNTLKRTYNELAKLKKDMESDLCKFESRSDELDKRSAWYLEYAENMKSSDNQLLSIMKQIDVLREETQANRASEQDSIDQQIHWLMAELDTGGNIRMEAGSIERAWFKNCIELVTSTFSVQDFAAFGITGVSAHKVTRIHNRFLQDRFEKHIESRVKKKHVDYLLYGEKYRGKEELQHIVEEGFPYSPMKGTSEVNAPVLLSNSIGLADICRVQAFQAISDELRVSNSVNRKVKGWLLIVKAYFGVSVEDQDVGADFSSVMKASYPNADSVYRIHPSDPTQRSWFVFDSYLVVPEYLVEFEYVFGNEASRGCSPWQTERATQDDQYVSSKSRFMMGLHSNIESQILTTLHGTEIPTLKSRMQCDQSKSLIAPERCYLCGTSMLERTSFFDRSKITYLNLHNSSINVLEPIKGLSNLKVLILSFNNISHIGEGFQAFALLEVLDLSFNLLKQIDGLGCLKALTTLDLSGNQLSTMNDLQHLLFQGLDSLLSLMELYAADNRLNNVREISNIHSLPILMVLDLSGNQLCEASEYRGYTIFMLKKLKVTKSLAFSFCFRYYVCYYERQT